MERNLLSYVKCMTWKLQKEELEKINNGEYTCQTKKWQSTINYVIMSMELFPKTIDFYIYTFDIMYVRCSLSCMYSFLL